MTETPNPNIIDADTMTGEMRPIRRCVISIGSNLGDRVAKLQGAVSSLADTPEVWVTEVSSIYETAPVGAPTDSDSFLNAVILCDTTLSAGTILERTQAIEDAFGRTRTGIPNEPRTLDMDLIAVGERRSDTADLTLPHPRAHERAFVLVPWLEVEPDGVLPGRGPVKELLEGLDCSGVHRREDVELTCE